MSDFDGWIAPVGTTSLEDVIETLRPNAKSGAITTFSGIVREVSDDSQLKVTHLEVEAWEKKGSDSMKEISKRSMMYFE